MSFAIGDPITCRCPKCGSRNLNLYEMFTVSDLYEIRDGKLIDRLSDESPNATGHVEGECIQCKHRWRLRGNPLQKAYMKSEDQD